MFLDDTGIILAGQEGVLYDTPKRASGRLHESCDCYISIQSLLSASDATGDKQ